MYNPVVRATLGMETLYVAATFEKPAASTGVIPPPTIQYRPSESSAISLLHDGQFKGSFIESSGCGSSIIFPSAVLFFSSTDCPDRRLDKGGFALEDREPGGKGEGREETDVLAGALRIPRGSLRLVFDISRIDPRRPMN